jgi:hypothetical protein
MEEIHEKPSTRNLRNIVPVHLGLGATDPAMARPALWFRWKWMGSAGSGSAKREHVRARPFEGRLGPERVTSGIPLLDQLERLTRGDGG